MKNLFYFIFILFGLSVSAQVGIGVPTANMNASAQLEVVSTTKGFLTPRMTEAQKNTIDNPATGLLIYQTDETSGFYYYDGSAWKSGLGAQGLKGDKGEMGSQGNRGLKGDTGLTGAKGEQGPQGEIGMIGEKGDKGPKGDQGATGSAGTKGDTGDIGAVGMSAYQVAVSEGYIGTEAEWITSLIGVAGIIGEKGDKGDSGLSSVGAISPTSTVNGASVNAGELNLAPADENNGGIVTNATQIFAGAKTFSDATTISNTTSSVSKTSGALVINGGVGIDENLNVGQAATISSTTGSISTSTGALVVGGGVGINENLNVGGTIIAGVVTYPNVDGASGQVLTTNGAGVARWTTPSSGSGSSGSSLQSLSTNERDALGVSTSGQLVFNTDTNTFQGSKKILPPYDYYTTIQYGYFAISPGHRVTQTFTAAGQTISSAKIAITSRSQFASNSGNLTFAIHDDVFDYDLFSTTITISGTGDIIVPISAFNWMNWSEGPLILPTGPCSFVISSDSNGGGSANFLSNGVSGVGTTIDTLWQSIPGYYNGPDTGHPLSIALYPKDQTGVIWVDISK